MIRRSWLKSGRHYLRFHVLELKLGVAAKEEWSVLSKRLKIRASTSVARASFALSHPILSRLSIVL